MSNKKIEPIEPLGDRILLDIKQAKLGAIDASSLKTGVEWAHVIAVGPEVTIVQPGDLVFVKAWSVDVIQYEGKDYHFTAESLKGICARLNK